MKVKLPPSEMNANATDFAGSGGGASSASADLTPPVGASDECEDGFEAITGLESDIEAANKLIKHYGYRENPDDPTWPLSPLPRESVAPRTPSLDTYRQFIANKRREMKPSGFDVAPSDLNPMLFPFQRDIVRWALKLGKAAMFLDTGLGKTISQLTWAEHVHRQSGGNVLLLAPLAVGRQTFFEASKFNIGCPVKIASSQMGVESGITITNYEKLHNFDAGSFSGIVLDESSILKNESGKRRQEIIDSFQQTPYRLACTATPAPNDHMELGNHAEFLGAMTRSEMLSMFFVHDGGDTSKWRLKGHAEDAFWQWMAGWSVAVRKPSDLGYSDEGYNLPELCVHEHILEVSEAAEGFLFPMDARTLGEKREARRSTISHRTEALAELVNSTDEAWVVWCNLNDESKAASKLIHDAVEVTGSDKDYEKESKLISFIEQKKSRLVSKGRICGYGMNLQFCRNVGFLGLSDSWEEYYQCIRRCYRFGQKRPVNVHIFLSDREMATLDNIKRKGRDADKMADGMIEHMKHISTANVRGLERTQTEYQPKVKMRLPSWA